MSGFVPWGDPKNPNGWSGPGVNKDYYHPNYIFGVGLYESAVKMHDRHVGMSTEIANDWLKIAASLSTPIFHDFSEVD